MILHYKRISLLLADTLEVGLNYSGLGILTTKGTVQDREIINIATQRAKETGETILLSGHSAGGMRNYVNLVNSAPNQYLDQNGRSVLQVQFYGAPENNLNLENFAKLSGATYLGSQNNNGDFVGNFLGGNFGAAQAAWSALNVISLFDPKIDPNLENIKNNPSDFIKNPKNYFEVIPSPHSNYYYQDFKVYNPNLNQNLSK